MFISMLALRDYLADAAPDSVGARCFSRRELDFSPAEKPLNLKWALAPGI